MSRVIEVNTIKNGLTVIVEPMLDVQSVAYGLYIPGGLVHDHSSRVGESLLLGDMISRGAGPYDSQGLLQAFEEQGIVHSEGGGMESCGLKGACLASDIERALELTAYMVHEPRLPAEELESVRSPFLMEIATLPDNPARRVMLELSSEYLPAPFDRSPQGTEEGLLATTAQDLVRLQKERFKPAGSVLSFAGRISVDKAMDLAERYFGDWSGVALERPRFDRVHTDGKKHVQFESAQLQVALAFASAPFGSEHFYTAKVAAQLLSGGMFGRLFIEVREKRGLCYSVYARHSSDRDHGLIIGYAGTTPERAHETLDVMMAEFERLPGTVTPEELKRAKANLRSSMVISEESSSSRVASNAGDWIIAKRVRTDEEIIKAVDAVDAAAVEDLFKLYPPKPNLLVTLGSREL